MTGLELAYQDWLNACYTVRAGRSRVKYLSILMHPCGAGPDPNFPSSGLINADHHRRYDLVLLRYFVLVFKLTGARS